LRDSASYNKNYQNIYAFQSVAVDHSRYFPLHIDSAGVRSYAKITTHQSSRNIPMTAIQLGLWAREPRDQSVAPGLQFLVDEIDASAFQAPTPGPNSSKKAVTSAITIVAAYIPAEAIGFYVTATALLGYPRGTADALIAGVSLALVVVLVCAAHGRGVEAVRQSSRLRVALAFSLVAASVYIAAMPQSFVHEWHPYTSRVSAVALLAFSIVLPAFGQLLRFAPASAQ
jgi:hypothetical protein